MLVEVYPDYEAMSDRAAEIVTDQIRRKPDSVIGFATGSTPLGLYKRLIENHRERGLDFSKITTFNLDEYIGLSPTHDQSYHYFMWKNFFSHVNVTPARVHLPQGMADDVEAFCGWYEERIAQAGGIDVQILGIGANGHIAFNEPGSSLGSRTRIKTLTQKTIEDNARFFDEPAEVPRYAITMGIGTIMDAKQVLLVSSGASKADAIKATLEGPITAMVPATIVQLHRHAYVLLDEAAASKLHYRHHHGIIEPKEG
jgi:glucosamine-6-phosphate deaminase